MFSFVLKKWRNEQQKLVYCLHMHVCTFSIINMFDTYLLKMKCTVTSRHILSNFYMTEYSTCQRNCHSFFMGLSAWKRQQSVHTVYLAPTQITNCSEIWDLGRQSIEFQTINSSSFVACEQLHGINAPRVFGAFSNLQFILSLNSSSTIFCPLPLSLYSYFFYCLFEYISSHPIKFLCSFILHLFFSPTRPPPHPIVLDYLSLFTLTTILSIWCLNTARAGEPSEE
jgi:hypothetical protein